MTKRNLLNNLRSLAKEIQPQKDWKTGLENRLLAQLESQAPIIEAGFFVADFWQKIFTLVLRPAVIALAVIGFVGINSLNLALAKNSLPGSFLYNYKKLNEKVTLSLVQDQERKISLKASFANQRLIELNQLAKRGDQEKTLSLMNNFQESLNDIKISFSQIGEEGKAKDLLKLAFILDAQTTEYEKLLTETNKETDLSEEAKNKIKTALNDSDQTSSQALKVAIKDYESNNAETTKDMLSERLQNKIERAEDNFVDLGDLPVLDNKMEEAKKSLAQAKEYLAEGSFSMALSKIEESKKIASSFAKAMEDKSSSAKAMEDKSSSTKATEDKSSSTKATEDKSSSAEAAENNQGKDSATGETNNSEINQNDISTTTDDKKEQISKPVIGTNNLSNKQNILPTVKVEKKENIQKGKEDFQTGLIKENESREGFFGGLIKGSKK